MVVLVLLGSVLFGAILWDTIGMGIVGFPKSDEKILEVLETLKNNKPEEGFDSEFTKSIWPMYQSKILDETLIYTFGKPYLSKTIKGVVYKWYVDGYGAVPRWYKSHSEIEKLYNELKDK